MSDAASYSPAALALLLGGLIACFAGYRLFRIVLAIFGGILGAFVASAVFSSASATIVIAGVIVGGLVGAALLNAAYFLGVALVGAGLGAASAHLVFTASDQDPGVLMVVLLSIAGAAGAMVLQRYFLVVGTAFGGAWSIVIGALTLGGDRSALSAMTGGYVWAVFPPESATVAGWVCIGLAAAGILVQLVWTGGSRARVRRSAGK